MKKQIVIRSVEELYTYELEIKENAELAIKNIRNLIEEKCNMDILFQLKFSKTGYEPIFGYELNLIEQLNQMYSYVVSLKGVEVLIKEYPEKEFIVNLGTQSGYDIISADGEIICECFAATNPRSNRKLMKDLERLDMDTIAVKKYEFFYVLEANAVNLENLKVKYPGIELVRFRDMEILCQMEELY